MNATRSVSVHKAAWFFLSGAVFLFWVAFLWDWPMQLAIRLSVLLGVAVTAVLVGWVLQLLWGFAIPVLSWIPQQQSSHLNWALLAGMAVAAPALADSVHTLFVVSGSIRFYNAELGRLPDPLFWILWGARSAVTFLLLWPFAKVPIRHRTMWICCVALWTYLDFKSEVTFR